MEPGGRDNRSAQIPQRLQIVALKQDKVAPGGPKPRPRGRSDAPEIARLAITTAPPDGRVRGP